MTQADAEAQVHAERGLERLKAREFEAGIPSFDKAIRLDSGCADAFLGRGLCWHHLEEFGNALSDYDAAIRLRRRP